METAQKVLEKGTAYDVYANAIRKGFDKTSQRLQSGTNANSSSNGGTGYKKESPVANGLDFETEKEKGNFTNTQTNNFKDRENNKESEQRLTDSSNKFQASRSGVKPEDVAKVFNRAIF